MIPDPATFLAWCCGTRADAETFAQDVAHSHGLTRAEVVIRPAPYGYDVHRRTA